MKTNDHKKLNAGDNVYKIEDHSYYSHKGVISLHKVVRTTEKHAFVPVGSCHPCRRGWEIKLDREYENFTLKDSAGNFPGVKWYAATPELDAKFYRQSLEERAYKMRIRDLTNDQLLAILEIFENPVDKL